MSFCSRQVSRDRAKIDSLSLVVKEMLSLFYSPLPSPPRYLVMAQKWLADGTPFPPHVISVLTFEREVQVAEVDPNTIQIEVEQLQWRAKEVPDIAFQLDKKKPVLKQY